MLSFLYNLQKCKTDLVRQGRIRRKSLRDASMTYWVIQASCELKITTNLHMRTSFSLRANLIVHLLEEMEGQIFDKKNIQHTNSSHTLI